MARFSVYMYISKEYQSTAGYGSYYTHVWVSAMLIVEDPTMTMKYRPAI